MEQAVASSNTAGHLLWPPTPRDGAALTWSWLQDQPQQTWTPFTAQIQALRAEEVTTKPPGSRQPTRTAQSGRQRNSSMGCCTSTISMMKARGLTLARSTL